VRDGVLDPIDVSASSNIARRGDPLDAVVHRHSDDFELDVSEGMPALDLDRLREPIDTAHFSGITAVEI
jgi:hypothetical protein